MLAEVVHERFFRRGATLAVPGQLVTSIYLIRSGKVNILREGIAVRTLGGRDVVGAIAAMTRDPSGQHLVVAEDTDTFEISVDDLEDVFEDSYPVLLAVTRTLARAVISARQKIREDAGFDATIEVSLRSVGDLNLVERIVFVRNLMAYGRAKIEALAELALEMVEKRFSAGTVLWKRESYRRSPIWSRAASSGAKHGRATRSGSAPTRSSAVSTPWATCRAGTARSRKRKSLPFGATSRT